MSLLQRRDVGPADATIDEKRRGVDEGGVVAREKEHGVGDLFGFGEATGRDVHQAARGALGVLGEELLGAAVC